MLTNLELFRLVFGVTIKRLRKQRGITQSELAESSKIDRSYLSGLESGSRNIALNNICQLATALEMLPSTLFKIVESNYKDERFFEITDSTDSAKMHIEQLNGQRPQKNTEQSQRHHTKKKSSGTY